MTLEIKCERVPPLVGCVDMMIYAFVVALDAPPSPSSSPPSWLPTQAVDNIGRQLIELIFIN